MHGYDYYVIGVGNPNHPANQPNEEPELVKCDSCETYFPEDELNIDRLDGGKDTGWRWCDECLAEMQQEEKEMAAVEATANV